MLEFVLAQIFFCIASAFAIGYNFFKSSRTTILYCGICNSIAVCISYVLLDALTAAIINLICIALNVIYFFKDKNKFFASPVIPLIFILIFITCGVLTWSGWMDIFPILTNVVYAAAQWLKKEKSIKLAMLLTNSLLLTYYVLLQSYVAVACIALMIIAAICYLIWGEKYTKYMQNIFRKKNNKNC